MKTQAVLKGHPVSLSILDYGLFRVHSNGRVIGICGYFIRTSAGEQVLIDTGFPAKYAAHPLDATLQDRLDTFGEVQHCTPDNLPGAQLARLGTTLDQIDLMIQTHTHIDHIGGMDLCPQAPILMAAAERAEPRPLYWGKVQPMTWPDREYLLIEEDTQIGPGFDLILTPGHAPGQLAMMLTLPDTGPVLLTSDAISRPSEPRDGFDGAWDSALAAHHAARILDMASAAGAWLIYGHCPAQWPKLRKAPHTYG